MNNTQDFVNLFTTTNGELFYFIAIFIIYQAALLMAFDQRRRSEQEVAAGRYVVALWMALAAWLILISSTVFSLLNDSTGILPPLESTVNTIVIVALSYGLLTAEYQHKIRIETLFGVGLVALMLAGLGYTLQTWDNTVGFYEQSISVSWVYLTLVLSGGSILLLFWRYRHVADIPLKFIFFATLIVGHVYTLRQQLLNEQLGDAAGAIRWSLMISGLLLVMIIYRMVIERMMHAVDTVATYAEHISKPLKTVGLSSTGSQEIEAIISERITAQTPGTSGLGGRNEALALLKALGIMLDKADTNAIPGQSVQAVADMIKADIVALVSYEDANWADIAAAYDFGRKRPIAGMSINLAEQPTLAHALEQKRQQRLDPDESISEIKDLYARFDMPVAGTTYFQPLVRSGVVVGALIVGFPYTRRDLRVDEQRLLESIAPIAARLVMISRAARIERVQAEERAIMQLVEGASDTEFEDSSAAIFAVRREMQVSFEMAQQEIDLLNQHIQQLEADLKKERQKLKEVVGHEDEEALSITQRVEAISIEREQLQRERRQLAAALKEAQATLIGATADDEITAYKTLNAQLQEELLALRQQHDRLANQLAGLKSGNSVSQRVQQLLDTLIEDQSQLEVNREQVHAQLEDTQAQLAAIGVQSDFQGLMDQISKLKDERDFYKNQAQRSAHEREMLLKERKSLETAIEQEQERTARIQALEAQIARLAEDREVLIKQRNHLSSQRDSLSGAAKEWQTERDDILQQQNAIQEQKEAALKALSEATEAQQHLISERNILRADNERLQHEYQALLARVDGNRERLNAINDAGLAPLQQMIEELSQARTQLEDQLAQATQQISIFERQLNTLPTANGTTQAKLPIDMDVIVALAQELRSPLSVIMGYTDTVLGESVGILGALQRKLLTRVKANVDRLAYLVEELVQIAILDSGGMRLEPKKVNVVDFIDDAIASIRYRFGEKGIILDMELADDSLYVQADEEALRQIVSHLIHNAYLVSPTDGTVKISAHHATTITVPGPHPAVLQDVVVIAIQDHGGGIRPEDEARVFTRLYRAENPLIEGLGDTGVGMSITKALIEAHSGRIWMASARERGANTFMFAIPTRQPILQAKDATLTDER